MAHFPQSAPKPKSLKNQENVTRPVWSPPCLNRSEVFMDQAGRNTYRDGFEAKPCGIGPKPCGIDSKTSGFVLKPIRFGLPACSVKLVVHRFGPESIRNHARADVWGSFPCGNESLPHRNNLQQVLWNQRMKRCAILRHDIGSLSHDIGSLSHDNKPFPYGFDSFPYRFNRATIGFRPSTIAFVLKTSDLKALRYCSAPDSCALAADSSFFAPG